MPSTSREESMDEAPICALGGAMFKLPGKLDGLLRHGYMLPRGAGDEIPLIKRDLEEIIAILQDHISRSDHPSVMVNCWMKEVRELSYDIEDCIDQYKHAADSKSRSICKVTRRKFTSSKTNRLSEKLKRRLWMANKIREFSARVQEALQRHKMYNLGGIGRTPLPPPPTYDASFRSPRHIVYGEAADLVGIDAPMNKLEEWLIKDGDQKLKVVSIVGLGGIGKTTLANELYCKLGGQFECRAFVRASQKPDMRRLLISMLSQVRPHHPPDTWKVHNIIADIRTHLQDKRYLIVVDDVWATSTWDIINCTLPDDNRSSRILLTTEIEDVAHKCCGYDSKYVFMMKPLGDDDSKKLFFNTVFGPKHECPPELAEVSNSIIRKCGGLPLATVTIAGLLASQMGKQEQWDYLHRSLCYGLRTNTTLEGTKQVLNLSYTNLPHNLKACMVYLSIYEEDYIVWKDDLVKQWIAEGFIYATEEQDNEEIAGSYFDELVSRRMIQPVDINDNDEVLSCVVHHMVLNLIAYKSIEENFIIAIDHSQTTTRLADKVRRLSLHFGNAEDATPPINMRLSQVRTLAFFGVFKCVPSIVEFRLLQVLILQVWGDEESISFDLARMSQLFRLRYLQVTCNVTLELRTQLRGLQCLEVLKIDARASAVPSDIVHLPGLMHLNLPAETNLPNGIGHMTSLRTLGYFDLSGNSTKNVQSLGELTNLRDLQLTCYNVQPNNLKNNIQCLGSILRKLNNLKSITLVPASSSNLSTLDVAGSTGMSISGDGLSSVSAPPPLLQRLELLPRVCIFSSLPKWIGHLSKLCILKIGVRELARSDVDVLRGLPALTVLSLYVRTKPAERIVFDKAGFTVLKYFEFRCSVPWLKFEADAMPNLRKLKLGFNSLGADQHGSAHIIIEHLLCLKEISAKVEGTKADAESTLTTTVSNHPSNPRINVQLVDCIFLCDESRSMGTKENEHRTLEEQDEILEEDTDDSYITQVEDSREDANKLGEPLMEEYKLYKGVREQVESLRRELESMHAALRKVAEVPWDQLDEQVKLWARDVRELSYDTEDVVDTFLVRVEKMGNLFSKGKTCRQIADVIKDINKQIQEVANRYVVDSIVAKPVATSAIDPRHFAMYKNAARLVGIDGPRDALIKMLSEGEGDDASKKKMKIVSVVGFGGLGKTTLATAVYHKLKAGFNCHAFVPVGQNPDMKKVLKDILIGLDKQKYTNLNMTVLDERQLIDELREFLKNKRYFIVIDDIWDKKSWKIIRYALADSNCGSIVVATTRISEVATNAGDVYKLQPLSRDNSEKLFCTRIIDCEGKCPHSQSTEVHDKILKKCGGVPLAIITIASLLASKPGEDWSEVYNYIGFGHGYNQDVENTRKILAFSYYDLPSNLRTCLLYLSVFPEDYLIRKDILIRKWIAEGFIHEEHEVGLLEVGERYFNKLINRSMIQPVEREDQGHVYGCRVHDMVLDLIRSLSRDENFVTILDNEQRTFPQSNKARRLALHHRKEEHNPQANMDMQHVRSFIATLCHASVISTSFRVLRVLAIEDCGFMEGYNSLGHLGNLLHLRYLGLTGTPVRELPKEIGNLKFLQTLELFGTGIQELSSSIGLLTQLVFLRADRNTRVPDWIGNLTSLQELWIWPAADRSARFVKELGILRELRVLITEIDVVDESMERALVESLGNLHRIQLVNITGKSLWKGATWESGFVSPGQLRYLALACLEFSRPPAWINSSHLLNLCFLNVKVHVVQEQDMETLGRLPQLRGIELWSWYTPVVSMTVGGDGHLFDKLRFFTMHHISVRFEHSECSMAPIMPSLEALKFTVQVRFMKDADLGFDKLGLENLPSLQKVTAHIDCEYARAAEVEEAEAALSHAAIVHPNRPTLRTLREFEDGMLSSEQGQVPAFISDKVVDHTVNVREEKDEEHYFNFCRLLRNPCVEKLNVSINCEDAWPGEVEEAEAAVRFAVDVHPNHPTLEMTRYDEDKMMLSDQHQQPSNEISSAGS